MPTPDPTCTINGGATPADVTAAATINGALASSAGAVFWTVFCSSTDELNTAAAINATLTINQGSKTFAFTAPALGSACIFTSQVGIKGLGLDANGVPNPAFTTTFKVNVKTSGGRRVLALNEVSEQGPAGWGQIVNDTARTAGTAVIPPPTFFASLASTTPVASRASVVLDGYSAIGDGGGGNFVWSAASTATADGGTVSVGPGGSGVPGRWLRTFSGPLSVRWFGAKGDNVIDDLGAWNATQTAAIAAGAGMYVPPGDYYLSASFEMGLLLSLQGSGWSYNGQDCYTFPNWTLLSTSGGYLSGCVVRFHGNNNGLTRNGGNAVCLLSGIAVVGSGVGQNTGIFCNPVVNGRLNIDAVAVANWYVGINGGVDLGSDGQKSFISGCVYGLISNDGATSCHRNNLNFSRCVYPVYVSNSQVWEISGGVYEACSTGTYIAGLGPREVRVSGMYQELTGSCNFNFGTTSPTNRSKVIVPGVTACTSAYNNRVYVCPLGGGGTTSASAGDPAGFNIGGGIASITVGNPTTITTNSAHGLVTGRRVGINPGISGAFPNGAITPTGNLTILTSNYAVFGSAQPYGWVVTVTGANTFTIAVDTTAGLTSSNATISLLPHSTQISSVTNSAGTCLIGTTSAHGLKVGDSVAIYQVVGTTEVNSVATNMAQARATVATTPGASTFTIGVPFVHAYTSGGAVHFFPRFTDGTVTWEDLGPGGGVLNSSSGDNISLTGAGIVLDIRAGTVSSVWFKDLHCSDQELVYVPGAYGSGNTVNNFVFEQGTFGEIWAPPSLNGIVRDPSGTSVVNKNPSGFGVNGATLIGTSNPVRYASSAHAISFQDAATTGYLGGMEAAGTPGNEVISIGSSGTHQPERLEGYAINLFRILLNNLEYFRVQAGQLVLGISASAPYGIEWAPLSSPYLAPQGSGSDIAIKSMSVWGQDAWSSSATNINGGPVVLAGGASKSLGVGLRGGVRLGLGHVDTNALVESCEPVVAQRVAAFCNLAPLTSTQMPAGTGDGVMFVANCQTAPTAKPSGGCEPYGLAGGLTVMGSGGAHCDVAPSGTGTQNTQAGRFRDQVAFFRTSATTATTAYTYTMPASPGMSILTARWTAKDTVAAANDMGGYYVACFKNVAGTATQIGATNVTGGAFNIAGTGQLTFTVSGATVLVQVANQAANATDWQVLFSADEN